MSQVSEWVEVQTLKALSQHTVSIVASALSFVLITKTVRWAVGPGIVSDWMEYLDKFVLVVLALWFTYQMLLLLWNARVKFNGKDLLFLVA